ERPLRLRPFRQDKPVACLGRAFLQHPVVPAGASAFLDAIGHVRPLEAGVEPPAGLASLRDLQQRAAEAPDVADADIGLSNAEGGDVLAEGRRLRCDTLGRPCGVVVAGIMVDGLFRPAMAFGVALVVAGKAEAGDDLPPGYLRLADAARGV